MHEIFHVLPYSLGWRLGADLPGMLPEARAHKVPASERTSQKLDALLSQGVGDGDARAELLKLAVRKIVEEALEPDRSKPFVSRVRGAGGTNRRARATRRRNVTEAGA